MSNFDFFGAFSKLLDDCISVTLNPMVVLFPKIVELKWGKANKINYRNSEVILNALEKYFSSTKDENSLYHQLTNSGIANPQEAI